MKCLKIISQNLMRLYITLIALMALILTIFLALHFRSTATETHSNNDLLTLFEFQNHAEASHFHISYDTLAGIALITIAIIVCSLYILKKGATLLLVEKNNEQLARRELELQNLLHKTNAIAQWRFYPKTQMLVHDAKPASWMNIGIPAGTEFPVERITETIPNPGDRAQYLDAFQRGIEDLVINRTIDEYTFTHSIWDRHVQVTCKLVEYQGEEVVMGYSTDISELYESQQLLIDAVNELQNQRDKEEKMLAVIGHELRTPAAALKMQISDLNDSGNGKISQLSKTADHLLVVLDDLKYIASNDQNILIKNPVNINSYLHDTVESLRLLVKQLNPDIKLINNICANKIPGVNCKDCSKKCDKDDKVYLNTKIIRQTLTNLIKNAAIHSQGTQIIVDIETLNLANTIKSIITVKDDGVGINDKDLKGLFVPFVRGSNVKAEGTGIGLATSKSMIKKEGGDLTYEKRREFSCFRIDLESDIVNEKIMHRRWTDQDNIEVTTTNLIGKKILFAEDNSTIRMLSGKILDELGTVTTLVEDGLLALSAARNDAFDIVITDYMMPNMDGIELIENLRSEGFDGIIIGCTAATIGTETDNMKNAGADVVIAKPFSKQKILEALSYIQK